MKLVLDKEFRIEGDMNSFTLIFETPSIGRKGRYVGMDVTSRDMWHYSNIRDCLLSYRDKVSGLAPEKNPVDDILLKYNELGEKITGMKEFVWSELHSEINRLKEEISELKKKQC